MSFYYTVQLLLGLVQLLMLLLDLVSYKISIERNDSDAGSSGVWCGQFRIEVEKEE